MKVVISGLIVLAIIVVVALVANTVLSHSGAKNGDEATYSLPKPGFAVSYDKKMLAVEIASEWPGAKARGPVYFVSRWGPRSVGPGGARRLPSSRRWTEVAVIGLGSYGPPDRPVAAVLKDWLADRPFGSSPDVRYHRTILNGMPGVTYDVRLTGARFMSYLLYAHGYEVQVTTVAPSGTPSSVWSALRDVAQSVGPTP